MSHDEILDRIAAYDLEHGRPPQVIWLPVLAAYSVLKAGMERLRGRRLSRWVQHGIKALERDGFMGMKVLVDYHRGAELRFA